MNPGSPAGHPLLGGRTRYRARLGEAVDKNRIADHQSFVDAALTIAKVRRKRVGPARVRGPFV